MLNSDSWVGVICNSTYFEYVLNVKVTTMTNDTEPGGERYLEYIFPNKISIRKFKILSFHAPNNQVYYTFDAELQFLDENDNTWKLYYSNPEREDGATDFNTLKIQCYGCFQK